MGQDTAPDREYGRHAAGTPPAEPEDVLLDIPTLHVDSIELEVDDLRARVSLQAEVLNLLRLNVGVDAVLGRVRLDIRNVDAQALLKVRLDRVAEIIGKVLETVDNHPEIIDPLARAATAAVEQTGTSVSQVVDEAAAGVGQAVGRVGGGLGETVSHVGGGVGETVSHVGGGADRTVGRAGTAVGETVGQVGNGVGETVRQAGTAAGGAAAAAGGAAGAAGGAAGAATTGAGGRSGSGPTQPGRARGERETRTWATEASPESTNPPQRTDVGPGGQPTVEAGATVDAEGWPPRKPSAADQAGKPSAAAQAGEPGQREPRGERRRYRGLPRRTQRRW
ncbi:hypothetical protein [Plantactinospora sp. GCM10030261]|uniref:hypothetical protein n=1 Tax=Plantactinospora sp. GCM10030261 TaxID=3273420 RepID=UPI003613B908